MIAAVAGDALLRMLVSSLVAGVGVAVVFSFAILGVTRSSEMRRSQRRGPATAYAALAAVGLLISGAMVLYGLFLVAHKS
jgi:hypothetical protein